MKHGQQRLRQSWGFCKQTQFTSLYEMCFFFFSSLSRTYVWKKTPVWLLCHQVSRLSHRTQDWIWARPFLMFEIWDEIQTKEMQPWCRPPKVMKVYESNSPIKKNSWNLCKVFITVAVPSEEGMWSSLTRAEWLCVIPWKEGHLCPQLLMQGTKH